MADKQVWQAGWAAWEEYARTYTQAYADFMIEATQRTIEQSLAFRRRVDQVVFEGLTQAQSVSGQEQAAAITAAESLQGQAQTALQGFARMFAPAARN